MSRSILSLPRFGVSFAEPVVRSPCDEKRYAIQHTRVGGTKKGMR